MQGGTEKSNHISTSTLYDMVAGERAITFLIAPQRQQRRRQKSWNPSMLLGTPKKGVLDRDVEAEIPRKKEEVDDGIPTYD